MPLFDAKTDEAVIQVTTRFLFWFDRPMVNITIGDRTYVVKSGTHYFDVAEGDRVVAISFGDRQCEALTRVTVAAGECAVVRYRVGWSRAATISVGAPIPIAIARTVRSDRNSRR